MNSQRDASAKLTKEELKLIEEKIKEVREELNISYPMKNPSYEVIEKIYRYVIDRFHYVSDDYNFGKVDFWNTLAFEWLMLDDQLFDDCDGCGMSMLEFAVKVVGVDKSNLKAVACQAESGEGHFVGLIKADDGVWYQVENRLPMFGDKPRSVKYMRDIGYEYWHIMSLNDRKKKWVKAREFISGAIYDTPDNLEADVEEITFKSATAIHKSKTLLKEWGNALIGTSAILVPTIQSEEKHLSQFLDTQTLGVIMVILSAVGVVIRLRTYKRVSAKKDYDK
jgi:predicted transglutaminase-like cysteine proteinase